MFRVQEKNYKKKLKKDGMTLDNRKLKKILKNK
jgi:hypothetical protein